MGTWSQDCDPSLSASSRTHNSETLPTSQSRNKILHTGRMLGQPKQQSGPETLTGTSAVGGFSHHKQTTVTALRPVLGKATLLPVVSRWDGAQESWLLCQAPAGARSAPGPRRSGWKGPASTRSSPTLVQCLPVPHSVPSGH